MKKMLFLDEMETPIGPITILASETALLYIEFGTRAERESYLKGWAKKYFPAPIFQHKGEPVMEVKRQLSEYFEGKRNSFTIPFQFYGTDFQKKIWNCLLTIPYGETCSYKDIADKIQAPKAVRAVGGAVNRNPISIIAPCHRVIGKSGKLVGYNGGLEKKEFLLDHERGQQVMEM